MNKLFLSILAAALFIIFACQPKQTPEDLMSEFVSNLKSQQYTSAHNLLSNSVASKLDTIAFKKLFDFSANFSAKDFEEMPHEYVNFIQTIIDSTKYNFVQKGTGDTSIYKLTIERYDFEYIAEESMAEMLNSIMGSMQFASMSEAEQIKVMGHKLNEFINKNPILATQKEEHVVKVLNTDLGLKIEI